MGSASSHLIESLGHDDLGWSISTFSGRTPSFSSKHQNTSFIFTKCPDKTQDIGEAIPHMERAKKMFTDLSNMVLGKPGGWDEEVYGIFLFFIQTSSTHPDVRSLKYYLLY